MQEIFEYIRNRNGQPIGLVLAQNEGIGWSALNPRDRFDKELALRIARGRIQNGYSEEPPRHVQAKMTLFSKRAERYFKKEF
jgi:hypothetical protein